jgi:hypothetical protein
MFTIAPFLSRAKIFAVYVSERVGHRMTFKILIDDIHCVIHQTNIHSVHNPTTRNLSIDPLNDEAPEIIQSIPKASPALDQPWIFCASLFCLEHEENASTHQGDDYHDLAGIKVAKLIGHTFLTDPDKLIGCTFLIDPQEHDLHFSACFVEHISDHKMDVRRSNAHTELKCTSQVLHFH